MKNRKRNFKYGRSLKHATKKVLLAQFGLGKFQTRNSHYARFCQFITFLKKRNTTNAVYITQVHLDEFADKLQNKVLLGQYAVSYCHNLISSINVVMKAFRADKKLWLSPKSVFGPRNHVRQVAPNLSMSSVFKACRDIERQGHCNIAILIMLARLFGLRLKEAILIDAKNALEQAQNLGKIDVRKGTKGGRGKNVERWVFVNKKGLIALKIAAKVQADKNSFIPSEEKLITFYRRIHRVALPILKYYQITKIHDLRASYVCQRYSEELTTDAPIISGVKEQKSEKIIEAKKKISSEIGHAREYVISSYCGR